MKRQEMLDLLNRMKQYIGLSDYSIQLKAGFHDLGEKCYAEVDPDIYEKNLPIRLSHSFKNLPYQKQRNVLLHELVHGRIEVYNMRAEKAKEELEEELAIDLTRGLEALLRGNL